MGDNSNTRKRAADQPLADGQVPPPSKQLREPRIQDKYVTMLYELKKKQLAKIQNMNKEQAARSSDPDIYLWHHRRLATSLKADFREALESEDTTNLVRAWDRSARHRTADFTHINDRTKQLEEQVRRLQRDVTKTQVRMVNVPKCTDSLEVMILLGCCKLSDKVADNILRARVDLKREGVPDGMAPVLVLQCGSVDDARTIIEGSRKNSRQWLNPWYPNATDKNVQCVPNLPKGDYDAKMCAITLIRLLVKAGKWDKAEVKVENRVLIKVGNEKAEHFSKFLDLLPNSPELATPDEQDNMDSDHAILSAWKAGPMWEVDRTE